MKRTKQRRKRQKIVSHNGKKKIKEVERRKEPEDIEEDVIDEDEYDDDVDDDEVIEYEEDELDRVVPATPQQALAAQLFVARNRVSQLIQENSRLENENTRYAEIQAQMRKELRDNRMARYQNELNNLKERNKGLFTSVGLEDGDRVSDSINGHEGMWMLIPKQD